MRGADAVVGTVAARLRNAYQTRSPIAPIRDELSTVGIPGAYAVQLENNSFWEAQGRRVVGRKIGLTSAAVQRQLGVDQPDFGALFADMSLVDGEPIPCGAVLQPKVEAEAALVLSRDLERPDLTISELVASIDSVYAAIEVVGSRIAGWDISILDTIADNASSGMFVLGTRPVRPDCIELRDIRMSMEIDGVEVSAGAGSNCLGHPYRAALWLARRMAELGTPLRAGDTVMTGAMGAMAPLVPGSTVTARFDGLGTISTSSEGETA
jgi:2-keto-4-pentenoate hydratase